jgi:hypothetical protein
MSHFGEGRRQRLEKRHHVPQESGERRGRKGISPQMAQMLADGEFLFFISALICVICGQFRIRLRVGALRLWDFALESLLYP